MGTRFGYKSAFISPRTEINFSAQKKEGYSHLRMDSFEWERNFSKQQMKIRFRGSLQVNGAADNEGTFVAETRPQ